MDQRTFKIIDAVPCSENGTAFISVLNVDVSCYKNYYSTEPKNINLLTWLSSQLYKAKVDYIRTIEDDDTRAKQKALLPAITPSGLFRERNNDGIYQHSGLMQIDIDYKDNTHLKNYNEIKQQLSNIQQVAYCGLSISGRGYWALIPIAYPNRYIEHFRYLQRRFRDEGIVIDSACSDIARLRGYSYDPQPYFNHAASILQAYDELPPIKPRQTKEYFSNTSSDAKPWDHYNEVVKIEDVITQEFEIVGTVKDKIKIKRFGATSTHSGYIHDDNRMYLFSDGTIYPSREFLSPFDVYKIKYCNGDKKQATRELKDKGFGS